MSGRNHEVEPLIELQGGHTRLNLRGSAPPRPTRRNRRRRVELTEVPKREDEVFSCPSCGRPGQLDIREGVSGRCYLSCTSCFKMWQEVREPDPAFRVVDEAHWQMR